MQSTLNRRQKAAVVVHLLVSGGADPGLRELPPAQQRQLVRDMADLRFIDRETLADIVAEFAAELDSIGLHFPRDPAQILALLESQLSMDILDELGAEMGIDGPPGKGPWAQIANLEVEALAELIQHETDEVGAILLSKLPPARAADLMKVLAPDRADRLAAAFARTDDVAPGAVAQIGMALGRETSARPAPAFETDGVKRVGDILNAATSGIRRAILDKLEESNPDFANRVRAVVFSFENIPDRISPRDMPRVMRNVDNAVLVTALAGLSPDQAPVSDFILGSISKRMADQIREEIEERDAPSPEEHEDALGAVVAVVRQMEDDGELSLVVPED
ncbi:FliG C-terminal domain-containing protein [Jannaschia donghaensis]|uniref:Flagellar motor switch protein FliG n=1 Tax=Jannaschia donghaensis TaxID=420998 RepID=A0A0M6YMB7_9RHOB|nr:FliG C-terminal domain-containing protein [Jannaschia donghaensis]CTQ50407.1 Flagellar motor switch protein FliG [Jannaschia donghaensis]